MSPQEPGQGQLRGGIDLGGTKIQAIVADERNKVVGESRRPTPTEGGPKDVATEMAAALKDAAKAAGVSSNDLLGVGVGSPGDVNEKTGEVSSARNLPGWEGSFPLGETLSSHLGTPVKAGGDVQVAIRGEFELGAGRPYKSIVGVFWGTGVGGGLVLDGRLWLGRGGAGQIGHMVVKEGGARCPCGRRGCMEAYAGRKAMEAKARKDAANGKNTKLFEIMEKHDHDRLTSGIWARAIEHEDPLAEHLLKRAIVALGAGIASAVNLLDPEAVILGGGMGDRFGASHEKELRNQMHKHLFIDENPPDFKLAELGDFGGGLGAALFFGGDPRR